MTHDWIIEMQDRILQFHLECTDHSLEYLSKTLDELLHDLFSLSVDSEIKKRNKMRLIRCLFQLILYTRDIVDGLGQYSLSHMMVYVWYNHSPRLAKVAVTMFVRSSDQLLGSWKDIKYMCLYIKNQLQDTQQTLNHPLTQFCIEWINQQLKRDDEIYRSTDVAISNRTISFASKWIPRENSQKFGWLYNTMSSNYFPHYMASAHLPCSIVSAQKKCNAEYRMLLAKMNRHIDTVQIKQCSGRWSEIDYAKVSSTTSALQHRAFSNISVNIESDTVIRTLDQDRVDGAKHYTLFNQRPKNAKIKREKTAVEMVANTIYTLNCRENSLNPQNTEYDLRRLDWEWMMKMNGKSMTTQGYIPVVDTSLAMNESELHTAIALGSCILTNTETTPPLDKQTLCIGSLSFSLDPLWISFAQRSFHEKVDHFMQNRSFSRGYLNLYSLHTYWLDHLTNHSNKYTVSAISKMRFCVFTNITFDENNHLWFYGRKYLQSDKDKMESAREQWKKKYQKLVEKYKILGKQLYGCELSPVPLLFWDIRKVSNPLIEQDETGIFINGSTDSMIEEFSRRGLDGFQENPLSTLARLLENPRYYVSPLEIYIEQTN